MTEPLRLHLGCGTTRVPGFVNCDYLASPQVDLVFDLQQPWPFEDNCVSVLYASHVLEHLSDPFWFFREAWRVLQPLGTVLLRVPYGGHPSAWADVTHMRPWYPESFACVQPGYGEATGNLQYAQWSTPFGVHVDMRLNRRVSRWLQRFPWRRRLTNWLMMLWPQACEELYATLSALKTPALVEHYRNTHQGNIVSTQYATTRLDATGNYCLAPLC